MRARGYFQVRATVRMLPPIQRRAAHAPVHDLTRLARSSDCHSVAEVEGDRRTSRVCRRLG